MDERLAQQLMLTLYRSDRQTQALQHYQTLRRQLAEELGTDPGSALQRLHQQILTADPRLHSTLAPATAGNGHASRPVPRQLPAPPRGFVGRIAELDELTKRLPYERARVLSVSTISGTGGVGKTWLALRWAHDNLAQFPDGQLYVNLHGFDAVTPPVAPADAVRTLLDAMGVDPGAVPGTLDSHAALYRSLLAGKRMLILLDNARDNSQVEPRCILRNQRHHEVTDGRTVHRQQERGPQVPVPITVREYVPAGVELAVLTLNSVIRQTRLLERLTALPVKPLVQSARRIRKQHRQPLPRRAC